MLKIKKIVNFTCTLLNQILKEDRVSKHPCLRFSVCVHNTFKHNILFTLNLNEKRQKEAINTTLGCYCLWDLCSLVSIFIEVVYYKNMPVLPRCQRWFWIVWYQRLKGVWIRPLRISNSKSYPNNWSSSVDDQRTAKSHTSQMLVTYVTSRWNRFGKLHLPSTD